MASRPGGLSVVAGALARGKKAKAALSQDAIAKRWRQILAQETAREKQDVIPLLDGWIRRLERQAGSDSAAESR